MGVGPQEEPAARPVATAVGAVLAARLEVIQVVEVGEVVVAGTVTQEAIEGSGAARPEKVKAAALLE